MKLCLFKGWQIDEVTASAPSPCLPPQLHRKGVQRISNGGGQRLIKIKPICKIFNKSPIRGGEGSPPPPLLQAYVHRPSSNTSLFGLPANTCAPAKHRKCKNNFTNCGIENTKKKGKKNTRNKAKGDAQGFGYYCSCCCNLIIKRSCCYENKEDNSGQQTEGILRKCFFLISFLIQGYYTLMTPF